MLRALHRQGKCLLQPLVQALKHRFDRFSVRPNLFHALRCRFGFDGIDETVAVGVNFGELLGSAEELSHCPTPVSSDRKDTTLGMQSPDPHNTTARKCLRFKAGTAQI